MRKLIAFTLILAFMSSCAFAQTPGLTQFSCKDAQGNEQTEAIFAGYDLTMINIWATWCATCVEDIPQFKGLKNLLPENVNLITLCDDGEYESELTEQIVTEANANYITLLANQEIYDELLYSFPALPVTIFVDSQGNIVGEAQVGSVDPANKIGSYLKLIEEHLALLEA